MIKRVSYLFYALELHVIEFCRIIKGIGFISFWVYSIHIACIDKNKTIFKKIGEKCTHAFVTCQNISFKVQVV